MCPDPVMMYYDAQEDRLENINSINMNNMSLKS